MRHELKFTIAAAALLAVAACGDDHIGPSADPATLPSTALQSPLSASAALGQMLFQDTDLSVNRNQSCQTCHEPSEGGSAPLAGVVTRGTVVQGSVAGRFGDRRPPTTMYATLTPNYVAGGNPSGGLFWDGRATGAVLGNPAADQALGPFLNPAEQGLPDYACVAYRVRVSAYLAQYRAVWGSGLEAISFPSDIATTCGTPVSAPGEFVTLSATDRTAARAAYHNVARSIQAFEAAQNTFTSRLDLRQLSADEEAGRKLFSGKGKCHQCHTAKGASAPFTDFRFHNLGVPRHPANPVYNYTTMAFDRGLGGFTGRNADLGRFRTPTTRNVGLGSNRTYMHNGVFSSLLQVVDFYNSRDVTRPCTTAELADPTRYGNLVPGALGCWPAPEYGQNMDTKQMGNLGLTPREAGLIVAYLRAMTDQ